MDISLQAVGDTALKVSFLDDVSPKLNKSIQLFCGKLQESMIDGIGEWVPAFDSVTIYYEPCKLSHDMLCKKVIQLNESSIEENKHPFRLIHVPVIYGGEYGPDLQRVAAYNQLSTEDVITRHQSLEYLVYMLGFLPGFPYLGGLDTTIATPRLEAPRAKTFAGSVGIAHKQTGIYPVESPGGWNIIGKTPIQLFGKKDESAFLFRAGDYVRFYSISKDEFETIVREIKSNTYKVKIEVKKGEKTD